MIAVARTVMAATFSRYLLASAIALGVDVGLTGLLVGLGLPATAAAASGYSLGIAAHWLLSSRAVFAGGLADRGNARIRQKALFVTTAIIGLALTAAIVSAGTVLGITLFISKSVAIATSFLVTWTLRRRIVFRVMI